MKPVSETALLPICRHSPIGLLE